MRISAVIQLARQYMLLGIVGATILVSLFLICKNRQIKRVTEWIKQKKLIAPKKIHIIYVYFKKFFPCCF